MLTSIRITADEYQARGAALRELLAARKLTAAVLFDSHYILYYTGFSFMPTERPVAFLLNADGESGLLVPRLELEHAQANALAGRVASYPEYPCEPHPMLALLNLMRELNITGGESFGVDQDGYPWVMGYRGPSLSELTGTAPTRILADVDAQMMIKTRAEVALMREANHWGNLALTLLQRYTRPGATENEVSLRASMEASLAMFDAIGPIYRPQSLSYTGPNANYRGQIGRNSAIPHALANNIVFRSGDVLGASGDCAAWGYNSELERTFFLGEPADAQRRLFDHMLALQQTAFDALRPGVRCSDVDMAVRNYYHQHGLEGYWKHHTGHGMGMRIHEGPFLDIADNTEIRPGMVFSIEPGLYAAGIGGFRHSDTVLVTESGNEILTYFPRDQESCTIAV